MRLWLIRLLNCAGELQAELMAPTCPPYEWLVPVRPSLKDPGYMPALPDPLLPPVTECRRYHRQSWCVTPLGAWKGLATFVELA